MVICVLMVEGDKVIEGIDCLLLCIFGFVGELINLEVWEWYWKKIGNEKCLVVDIWWQIEIGGFMIILLFGVIELKVGLVICLFFGV